MMGLNKKLILVSFMSGFMSIGCYSSASDIKFISYDPQSLSVIKQKISEKSSVYMDAYSELVKNADKALEHQPFSITEKTLTPASGDKHDYYSFGPYWWPNPDTENHMPYIRKDGEINPEAKTSATDSIRLSEFSNDMKFLGLAYFYTGNIKYAEKAAEMVKVWFVDKNTKMNPNMDYAQAIPGIVNGRGIGIIDSRLFIPVIDTIELIQPSGKLSENDFQTIKSWFKSFNEWLLTSNNGFEESNWPNNHGAWYDAQVTAFAIFTDQIEIAKKQIKTAELRHLSAQINKNGFLEYELERTRPWHYTNFALEAFVLLGRYGEITGEDFWNFELDGRNLKKGLLIVAEQIDNPKPLAVFSQEGINEETAIENIFNAAKIYKDKIFIEKADYLQKKYKANINLLLIYFPENVVD